MGRWAVELGTLWALEPGMGLPPAYSARIDVRFSEAQGGDVEALAAAMASPARVVRERLDHGRRCFLLRQAEDGQIVCYGWVTRGVEHVGELERRFNLSDDEAYVWDCGTVPGHRRQSCYSALLSRLIYQLHEEETPRIWIGASRLNQPSVRGFANAGFQPVIDLTYRRLFRLTTMWLRGAASAENGLVGAAYRIVINDHERRIGRLAVGVLPPASAQ